jgi:predicted PurR-regulated permease PerM
MPAANNNNPLYIRLSLLSMGMLSFFYVLYVGQPILFPLLFSTIIAILLNPIVKKLCDYKFNRIVAIILSVIAALVIIGLITYFIISQAAMIKEALPQLKPKFSVIINEIINWISDNFKISKSEITSWVNRTRTESLNNMTVFIGSALTTLGLFLILPVYIFMLLFYKPLLLEFIARLFKNTDHAVVSEILTETKTLVQSYLIGLFIEAGLVAALNSLGLFILGIPYAILIGVIGALLNMIPYVGGVVAIAIPMFMAIGTKSPIAALWVFILYLVIQFIDNNFIVPKIVASQVKLNGLISIIVVFMGGMLWGIGGMFLAIPVVAIIKVIFDRIKSLEPFGFLFEDNQPERGKIRLNFKRK